jgi:hypothetical protein
MTLLLNNMSLEDCESRSFSSLHFKAVEEALNGYLTAAPLAHALYRSADQAPGGQTMAASRKVWCTRSSRWLPCFSAPCQPFMECML